MNTSSVLKAIGGVLLIEVLGESKLCCVEDMKSTKFFSTGQIFNAIRVLNDKTVEDYGKVWPQYRNQDGEISTDWKTLEAVRESCNSDWEFVIEVCDQLQEDVPDVIERKEVQAQLEKFRHGTLPYNLI